MPAEMPKDKDGQSETPDQFTLAGGRICGSGLEVPPLVFTRVEGGGGNTYRAKLEPEGNGGQVMQFLTDQAAVQALKDNMGYVSVVGRCETCKYFDDERSGVDTVLPAHCELNPAAFFPVEKDGRCNYHKSKPPSKDEPLPPAPCEGKGFHG